MWFAAAYDRGIGKRIKCVLGELLEDTPGHRQSLMRRMQATTEERDYRGLFGPFYAETKEEADEQLTQELAYEFM